MGKRYLSDKLPVAKADPTENRNARIASLLREKREAAEMSMTELASRANLSQQMISYIERGLRKPTLDALFRITDALGLSAWEIVKDAERK